MGIVEGTVTLSKDYAHPVERVFAAWSQPESQLAWGDPGEGWVMRFDQFRFAIGEVDICRFGPAGEPDYVNENRYLEIAPESRIVYATTLSHGGALNFAGTVAVTFESTLKGTRLTLIEQGIYLDGRDEVSGHRSGWESMLTALGRHLRDQP
jgi:uncharacterized protein YndB with AHSA1/START domain